MKAKLLLIMLFLALSALTAWVWPYLDPTLINLQGLLLVLGGTLGASIIGHSAKSVFKLMRQMPTLLREADSSADAEQTDIRRFLQACHWYRRGDPRAAERTGKTIADEFLRAGTILALDPHNGDDLRRMLQWRIRQQKEADNHDIRILRTMATFAPAFGMLGTLLGLVALLSNLGHSSLESIGMTMGFTLMSTLYGLAAANLLFRPLALKLEEKSRRRLLRMNFLTDALMMLLERQHPKLIGEYLSSVQLHSTIPAPNPAAESTSTAPSTAPGTAPNAATKAATRTASPSAIPSSTVAAATPAAVSALRKRSPPAKAAQTSPRRQQTQNGPATAQPLQLLRIRA